MCIEEQNLVAIFLCQYLPGSSEANLYWSSSKVDQVATFCTCMSRSLTNTPLL